MFYGQCWKCGERWELGTAPTCTCKSDDDDTMCYRSELEAAVKAEREAILKLVRAYVSNKNLEKAIQARERNPMPLFDDWGSFPHKGNK